MTLDYLINPATSRLGGSVLDFVGNTPMVQMPLAENDKIMLHLKLESYNPTGSVKARAASYILRRGLQEGIINRDTTIIESSSGNFGIALAAFCKSLELQFICVVDPNISSYNEMLISQYGAKIIKVKTPDKNGGYLLSRIEKVKQIVASCDNIYWVNQYSNKLNADAYYFTLGEEISDTVEDIDYAFIGVSSGGTITGLSNKLKRRYPNIKIIAVDTIGSVIFGNQARKRYIPGIGSSMSPPILKYACIDEVVLVDEKDATISCLELLQNHYLFSGGSSGSVYAAIKKYFKESPAYLQTSVLGVFPDGGEKYIDTIYNPDWRSSTFGLSF